MKERMSRWRSEAVVISGAGERLGGRQVEGRQLRGERVASRTVWLKVFQREAVKMSDKVWFFHGLESGPHGAKYQRLAEEFEVESPDFQGMDIWERLEKAERLTRGEEELVVVGSSFGGLLAALLYERYPERFRGYVLMAPALHREEVEEEIGRMPERAVVIHGVGDEVVPFEPVRAFCEARGVEEFWAVEDDHRLGASLEEMVKGVRWVLEVGRRSEV